MFILNCGCHNFQANFYSFCNCKVYCGFTLVRDLAFQYRFAYLILYNTHFAAFANAKKLHNIHPVTGGCQLRILSRSSTSFNFC
jgi:hypothetical protein